MSFLKGEGQIAFSLSFSLIEAISKLSNFMASYWFRLK